MGAGQEGMPREQEAAVPRAVPPPGGPHPAVGVDREHFHVVVVARQRGQRPARREGRLDGVRAGHRVLEGLPGRQYDADPLQALERPVEAPEVLQRLVQLHGLPGGDDSPLGLTRVQQVRTEGDQGVRQRGTVLGGPVDGGLLPGGLRRPRVPARRPVAAGQVLKRPRDPAGAAQLPVHGGAFESRRDGVVQSPRGFEVRTEGDEGVGETGRVLGGALDVDPFLGGLHRLRVPAGDVLQGPHQAAVVAQFAVEGGALARRRHALVVTGHVLKFRGEDDEGVRQSWAVAGFPADPDALLSLVQGIAGDGHTSTFPRPDHLHPTQTGHPAPSGVTLLQ